MAQRQRDLRTMPADHMHTVDDDDDDVILLDGEVVSSPKRPPRSRKYRARAKRRAEELLQSERATQKVSRVESLNENENENEHENENDMTSTSKVPCGQLHSKDKDTEDNDEDFVRKQEGQRLRGEGKSNMLGSGTTCFQQREQVFAPQATSGEVGHCKAASATLEASKLEQHERTLILPKDVDHKLREQALALKSTSAEDETNTAVHHDPDFPFQPTLNNERWLDRQVSLANLLNENENENEHAMQSDVLNAASTTQKRPGLFSNTMQQEQVCAPSALSAETGANAAAKLANPLTLVGAQLRGEGKSNMLGSGTTCFQQREQVFAPQATSGEVGHCKAASATLEASKLEQHERTLILPKDVDHKLREQALAPFANSAEPGNLLAAAPLSFLCEQDQDIDMQQKLLVGEQLRGDNLTCASQSTTYSHAGTAVPYTTSQSGNQYVLLQDMLKLQRYEPKVISHDYIQEAMHSASKLEVAQLEITELKQALVAKDELLKKVQMQNGDLQNEIQLANGSVEKMKKLNEELNSKMWDLTEANGQLSAELQSQYQKRDISDELIEHLSKELRSTHQISEAAYASELKENNDHIEQLNLALHQSAENFRNLSENENVKMCALTQHFEFQSESQQKKFRIEEELLQEQLTDAEEDVAYYENDAKLCKQLHQEFLEQQQALMEASSMK